MRKSPAEAGRSSHSSGVTASLADGYDSVNGSGRSASTKTASVARWPQSWISRRDGPQNGRPCPGIFGDNSNRLWPKGNPGQIEILYSYSCNYGEFNKGGCP